MIRLDEIIRKNVALIHRHHVLWREHFSGINYSEWWKAENRLERNESKLCIIKTA